MMKKVSNKKIVPLLVERKERAEDTNKRLHQALDRFEHNRLEVIPVNSKLSLRNLAIEAGVNKDTPFSRYKKGSISAGTYRFPEVVARFKEIKAKAEGRNQKNGFKNQIDELRNTIHDYENKFLQQARIANQQDQRIIELEKYCRDLESQISNLRQEKSKVLKF
jgi:hypothetical protein